jgi:hypothetical protein
VCEREREWFLLSVNGIIFMNGKTCLGGKEMNFLLPLITDVSMYEKSAWGALC